LKTGFSTPGVLVSVTKIERKYSRVLIIWQKLVCTGKDSRWRRWRKLSSAWQQQLRLLQILYGVCRRAIPSYYVRSFIVFSFCIVLSLQHRETGRIVTRVGEWFKD